MSRTRTALRAEALEDRLTPAVAGAPDPTFGTDGVFYRPNNTDSVPVLDATPDGRVVLFAFDSTINSQVVERLLPNGTPDPTFGTNGTAPVAGAPTTNPSTLVALPDGGVLLAGGTSGTAGTLYDVFVTRLLPDGRPDPAFGTNGTATFGFDLPGDVTVDFAAKVTLDAAGRIVVVGGRSRQSQVNGVSAQTGEMAAARLLPDGTLDPTFGSGGRVIVPFPVNGFNDAAAEGVAVGPDGRIVLAGEVSFGLTTYTPRGLPLSPPPPPIYLNRFTAAAVRLLPDGQLDPTFGTGGRVLFPPTQGDQFVPIAGLNAASVRPDGRIVVAGASGSGGSNAARLNPDGSLDVSYGSAGTGLSDPVPTVGAHLDAIDAQGRVVLVDGLDVARVGADGRVDAAFGTTKPGVSVITDFPAFAPTSTGEPPIVALEGAPAFGSNATILVGGRYYSPPNTPTPLRMGMVVRLIGEGPPPGFVASAPGTVQAGGSDDGSVRVLTPTNGTYAVSGGMAAFPGFTGTVRTATADVNGDGTPDYVDGIGPGGVPFVAVFDGKTGNLIAAGLAFEQSFTGGVFVAAGDLDGDGRAEIVVTADMGGGPNVVIFSVTPGGTLSSPRSFFALGNPAFRGGARPAVGDFNGDGTPDVAVGAGFLGGPNVEIHDGKALAVGDFSTLIGSGFFAFDGPDAQTLRNGVFLSAGDIDGDGFADLIAGGGPGGGPRVLILSGKKLAAGDVAGAYAAPVANFFFGNGADRGGVRVATTNADGDSKADLVVGSGEGLPSQVRVYMGKDFTGAGEPAKFQDLDPFGQALPAGVFVG
jgi:uncharacterized delta-60 repeat protein